jgi:hypothetical protein
MKKIILSSSLLLSILCANEQNYIELGGGFLKSKDNFSTESKETISSYGDAESTNTAIPYLGFYYGNKFNDITTIYAQSEKGELNLGTKINTNNQIFDIGLNMNLLSNDEWENPFLTGANRKETNTSEYGAYIGYGIHLNDKITTMLKYKYSSKSYDKETVLEVLKREGDRHILSLETKHMAYENLAFIYNLNYEKYSADGKASSYNSYGIDLGLKSNLSENLNLMLLTKYSTKEYDEKNPYFNKTIDSNSYGLNTNLKWEKPLSYENVYVSFKVGYEKEDANVNFYDTENTFSFISIGYEF